MCECEITAKLLKQSLNCILSYLLFSEEANSWTCYMCITCISISLVNAILKEAISIDKIKEKIQCKT